MRIIIKGLFVFLAITGAATLLIQFFDAPFGTEDFWSHRGVFFLIFITLFPRLTLLFSSVPFGGVIWWLGFFFAPRILVALLATLSYWKANPFLVVISWLVALSGETGEKYVIRRRVYVSRPRPSATENSKIKADAIDVDYKRLD